MLIFHCHCASLFSRRRLIIPPGLHRVHGLVAVVPGVQLLVPWVVVDAAVAGVALWEEYHRAFVAAEEREGDTVTVFFFNHSHLISINFSLSDASWVNGNAAGVFMCGISRE